MAGVFEPPALDHGKSEPTREEDILVFDPSTLVDQGLSTRHMDPFFKGWIISIGKEPTAVRMVLHISELMISVDSDDQLLAKPETFLSAEGKGFFVSGWPVLF